MPTEPPPIARAARPAPTRRRSLLLLVAIAVLLRLPGLSTGLFSDDLVQHWTLEQGTYGPHLRPWALFDFGTALGFEQADDQLGGVPWWTAPDWKVRFLRPVASLWIWAEHGLFPGELGHPLAALALLVALVLGVRHLALDLGLDERGALLAGLLLACEESTHLPVAWTANRNTLLEAVLGLLAVLAARAPGRGSWTASLAATALALCATGAKESGVALLVLVALALPTPRDRSGLARLAPRLLPLAVAGAYLALWISAGYGARSLFYPTPWEEPALVATRAPTLFVGGTLALLSPASLDLASFHPGRAATLGSLAVGLAALASAATLAVLDRQRPARPGLGDGAPGARPGKATGAPPVDRARDRRRLLVAWFVLTLGVQAAAPPSDRLLLLPAVPVALGLASLLSRPTPASAGRRRLWRGARAVLIASALPASAAGLVLRQASLAAAAAEARDLHRALATHPGAHEHQLLLQLPNALAGLGLGPAVRLAGGPESRRPWPLRFGRGALELRASGPAALELQALDGPFLSNPVERVFASPTHRPHGPGCPVPESPVPGSLVPGSDGPGHDDPGSSHPFGPGRIVVLDGPSTAAGDRLPAFHTVRLELTSGLEPARVGLFTWTDGRLVEVPWPTPDRPIRLPAARSRAALAP